MTGKNKKTMTIQINKQTKKTNKDIGKLSKQMYSNMVK